MSSGGFGRAGGGGDAAAVTAGFSIVSGTLLA
eukprot:CAMPEP_0169169508 /NCGR_PEP_ID=MMETSP1015-20121227/61606_1 /TAXON_ID=342587 /ORGANISM="Karlodinium micrum, Strain CCMP2283" /LENGTH=31 /DNA_ID= /DNA_START= /DNA_END= /DNA_ORIENTATION=